MHVDCADINPQWLNVSPLPLVAILGSPRHAWPSHTSLSASFCTGGTWVVPGIQIVSSKADRKMAGVALPTVAPVMPRIVQPAARRAPTDGAGATADVTADAAAGGDVAGAHSEEVEGAVGAAGCEGEEAAAAGGDA